MLIFSQKRVSDEKEDAMADSREPQDFDEWRLLASRDPEGFELARRRVLDVVIAQASEKRRQRLMALQWRIDRLRERSATPLAACILLSDLMWDSLTGDNGLLEAIRGDHGPSRHEPACHRSSVIPFHKVRPRQG